MAPDSERRFSGCGRWLVVVVAEDEAVAVVGVCSELVVGEGRGEELVRRLEGEREREMRMRERRVGEDMSEVGERDMIGELVGDAV